MPLPVRPPKTCTWWITYVHRKDAKREADDLEKSRRIRENIQIMKLGSGEALNKYRKLKTAHYVKAKTRYAVIECPIGP